MRSNQVSDRKVVGVWAAQASSRRWHPGAGNLRGAVITALVFAIAVPAAGQTYEIVNLGTLSDWEGSWSMAHGLNNNGQVTGFYTEAGGCNGNMMRPFLWENGVMRDLGVLPGHENTQHGKVNNHGHAVGTSSRCNPSEYKAVLWNDDGVVDLLAPNGVTWSFAFDINDAGQVVGWLERPDGSVHGYVWQGGVITDIGTLNWNCDMSHGLGINNVGQVVGVVYCDEDGDGYEEVHYPVLWEDGQLIELGFGDGDYGYAFDINDAGDVVGMIGYEDYGRETRAVLWQNGEIVDLGTPHPGELDNGVSAWVINSSGQIVGRLTTNTWDYVPFLWQDGVNTDLNELLAPEDAASWVLQQASDINDLGQITGFGLYQGQTVMAFLMTPTGGQTVNLTFTSNIGGVTITGDEMEPISVPETLQASIGDTYENLTGHHSSSSMERLRRFRFGSWRRVEGYNEDGRPRWVELSRHASLDLSLTEDMTVRNPVTGEVEIAIQAHYVRGVRTEVKDAGFVRRSGR